MHKKGFTSAIRASSIALGLRFLCIHFGQKAVETILMQRTTMTDKEKKYKQLERELTALVEGEGDIAAILANSSALLHNIFNFFWVGFYLVKGSNLVLGPFQGDIACYRINYGRGVCGKAWEQRKTLIVDDVEKFPGHIACSSLSKSEIVVPLMMPDGTIKAVLDVDSTRLADFDETDKKGLEVAARIITDVLWS